MFFMTDRPGLGERRDAAHSRRAAAIGSGLVLATTASAVALAHLPLVQPSEPERLWLDAVRWCLVAVLGWAAVVAAASVVDLLPSSSGPRVSGGVVRPARRLTTLLLAVSAWSTASPSGADVPPPSACAEQVAPTPDFLPVETPTQDTHRCRPTPTAAPSSAAPTTRSAPVPDWTPTTPKAVAPGNRSPLLMAGTRSLAASAVVVRRGDTLWSIVARHLGPDADPLRVAAAVPHWHSANRAVIGDDPNLLLPGQQLTPPDRDAVGGPR